MPITIPREFPGTPISPIVPTPGASPGQPGNQQQPVYLPTRRDPLPGQSYFDPSVQNLIDSQSKEDENFFSSHLNHGMDKPGLLAHSQDPMIQALEGNYTRQANNERGLTESENNYKSKMMASNATNAAAQKSEDVYRNELDNWQQQMAYRAKREAVFNQWKAAKEKGRLGLFNQIFNGVGSFVGAATGAGV